MDFVKLRELPKISATVDVDVDARRFKAYRKRAEESCGINSDVGVVCFSSSSSASGNPQLAVACGTKIQLYDVEFGKATELASLSKHKNVVSCLAFRGDGKLLIAGDQDGHVNIYDIAVSRSMIRRLRGHEGGVICTTFCPETTLVATGGKDHTVKIWDVPTGQVVFSLKGHSDSVRSVVAPTQSGMTLISGGADGLIIVWDLTTGVDTSRLSHGHPIEKLVMFSSGLMFFSIGGGYAKLWDVKTLKEVYANALVVKHNKPITSARVSECGDYLATSSFDMTVKIVRISDWSAVGVYTSALPVTSMDWKNESIVTGLENGSWTLRQKKADEAVGSTAVNRTAQQAVQQYYETRTIDVSQKANGGETNADYLFRKFEYRKLVDYVVFEYGVPHALSLAIVDELIQRGGLMPAVRGRSDNDLVAIVSWCNRLLIADPRISFSVVSDMLQTVVEGNVDSFASLNEEPTKMELKKAMTQLSYNLQSELSLQYKLANVAGIIQAVL